MHFATLLALLPLAMAGPMAEAQRTEPAPLYLHDEADLAARGGSSTFIIKFKPGTAGDIVQQAIDRLNQDAVGHHFQSHFSGFSAHLDRATVDILRMIPSVEYVEQDRKGGTTGFVTQTGSTWGLSRVSHRQKGHSEYIYDETAGDGVCVYITDSGVDDTHPVRFTLHAVYLLAFLPFVCKPQWKKSHKPPTFVICSTQPTPEALPNFKMSIAVASLIILPLIPGKRKRKQCANCPRYRNSRAVPTRSSPSSRTPTLTTSATARTAPVRLARLATVSPKRPPSLASRSSTRMTPSGTRTSSPRTTLSRTTPPSVVPSAPTATS